MKKRKRFRRTFTALLLVNLISLFLLTWFSTVAFRDFYIDQTMDHLENNALILQPRIVELMDAGEEEALQEFCDTLNTRNRLTIMSADGRVIGDSMANPTQMDNHADRPEFITATRVGKGNSIRFSKTLQRRLVYFAMAINRPSGPWMVIRLATPVDTIDSTLRGIKVQAIIAWLFMSLLASSIFLNFSRRADRSFERLRNEALRFAGGEYEGSLSNTHWEEVDELARALHKMAERLKDRAQLIQKQKAEVEAILSSMKEAVIAVDSDASILMVNRAMADLFQLDPENCFQRKVQETVRNRELNRFIEEALSSENNVDAELTVYGHDPQYLMAHGTRLRGGDDQMVGAVIVLNNITRLKHLENVRSQFVANVSHELRTPVTAIKGFVETLQQDVEDPTEIRHFLDIIARQTDRLSNIIEDLLSLSKIEQNREKILLGLEEGPIRPILERTLKIAEVHAKNKGIGLVLQCSDDLRAKRHPNLLEQAAFNLLDNAVKYSESGTTVTIKAERTEVGLRIDVADQGRGISQVHLSRLFERFYRVDQARSRDLGGTGLGLSIVKHIAGAHGGKVSVESEVDVGSTFTILLPN